VRGPEREGRARGRGGGEPQNWVCFVWGRGGFVRQVEQGPEILPSRGAVLTAPYYAVACL